MAYSSSELNDPEFIEYEFSPFGETLSPLEEGFFHDFTYWLYQEEVDITSRSWTEAGLTEQAYEGMQLSYNGIGNWPSMLESYFGSCWEEDQFSRCYGTLDNGLEKVKDAQLGEEQCESYNSYDNDSEMQPAYDCISWSSYGGEEDCHDYGVEEPSATYSYCSDEMRLCESIFGPWPCLSRQDQGSYVEQ